MSAAGERAEKHEKRRLNDTNVGFRQIFFWPDLTCFTGHMRFCQVVRPFSSLQPIVIAIHSDGMDSECPCISRPHPLNEMSPSLVQVGFCSQSRPVVLLYVYSDFFGWKGAAVLGPSTWRHLHRRCLSLQVPDSRHW